MQFRWLAVGCAAIHSLAAQTVVFDHVDVFDGYRILRGQTVSVQDGMIRDVRAAGPAAPPGAIDGRGETLLPGLIDAHCHIATEESLEQAAALGVTTELDMFGYPELLLPIRAAMARGEYPNAADFRTAGIGANAPGGHPSEMFKEHPFPALGPHDDAQAFVDARFAEGSDYLKILYDHTLPGLRVDQLRALVAAAHRRNKLVAVHETVQHDGLEAIEAGADEIEHVFDDSPISREFVDAAVANHVMVTPTLSVIATIGGAGDGPQLAADPRFAPYLVSWTAGILNTRLPDEIRRKHHFENACGAVRALRAAGVPILAGTDAPNPGTTYGASVHGELSMLVRCGLTPLEALHAATAGPAREFGLIDRGRIEAGRGADLLLVKGDPSADIRATRDIVGVWKAGRRIDRPAVARKLGNTETSTTRH